MLREGLLNAVAVYFDAIYFCDTDKLDQVFHPESSLFDADQGRIFVDPIESFRRDVSTRPSPASVNQVRKDEIILIDCLSERSALVKLRLRAHQNVFVDHLNFVLDHDDQWKIVAKVWHLERVIDAG